MGQTAVWTALVMATTLVIVSQAAVSVVLGAMAATVSWSVHPGCMASTAQAYVSVRTAPLATPRPASVTVCLASLGIPVLTPVLQEHSVLGARKSASVGRIHAAGTPESACVHQGSRASTAILHVVRGSTGQGAMRCASATTVALVTPLQASVHAL